MKIMILGGHGFIGHNLAHNLKQRSHQVSIVDCHHTYGEYLPWEYDPLLSQRLAYIGDHQSFIGSVTDKPFMESVYDQVRPDVVVDLATYPNAKMVKKNILDATENMIAATALALDLCVQYKVQRFVLASSSMVYGDFDAIGAVPDEHSQCNPLTLYGSYKLQCERMCRIWNHEHHLEYVLLRPSALYGVRDTVVRVISKMTVGALRDKKIVVNGPDNRLDFSYVTDVADAFAEASTNAACANQIFNCTRGQGRKIIEAAELIRARIPCQIVAAEHDSFYPNRDTLNSDRLRSITPWNPQVDIEQGINLYLDWFLQQSYISNF